MFCQGFTRRFPALAGAARRLRSQAAKRGNAVKNVKAKVAAGATVITLGGLTGLALSQGGHAPAKPVADKPVVHTKVIRRTIHVTKHAKPKHPPVSAPVEPAGATDAGAAVTTGSSGAGGGSETAPVSTGSSSTGTETEAVTTGSSSTGSEAAPVSTGSSSGGTESAPVATGASGAGGGGGGEVEHGDGGGGGGGADD
jgi:hypothetical protein